MSVSFIYTFLIPIFVNMYIMNNRERETERERERQRETDRERREGGGVRDKNMV